MTKVKNGIKIIVFIVIFAFIFITVQGLTLPYFTEEQGTNSGFLYEEKDTVDVIFLGSSNMFHTINPLVLYEEAGIRGFDFGSSAQSLNMSYMYLKEALKTQSPKVVCLEVYMAYNDFSGSNIGEKELRWGFTYFPTSINMMMSLYDQAGKKIDADYLSYIFPLFRYKSNWWNVGKSDFFKERKPNYKKGCYIGTKVVPINYEEAYWEEFDWEIAESNLEALNEIKALCDENEIDLVLFKSPNAYPWKNVYSKGISEYAVENEIPFIDYNIMIEDLGINVNTSFMDSGHLNLEGSVIVSKHMAEYLATNYNLPDYRNGEENSWDKACAEWHRREQNELLAAEENFGAYIKKVLSDGYTVIFSINREIDESHYNLLLSSFDIDIQSSVDSGIINEGEAVVLNRRDIDYYWRDDVAGLDYAIAGNRQEGQSGEVAWNTTVFANGVNCSVVTQGVNFVVYDNQLQEFVSVVGFAADEDYARYVGNVDAIQR